MPSPEQEQGPFQQEGKEEKEPKPYYKAARFNGEQIAGKAYFQAQDAIFNDPGCDLSVYRFQLNRIYHLAVLGESPSAELAQKLQEILSTGEPVPLPDNILQILSERRNQAIKKGPWVERHYRPGQHL
jgi:hypothetical protein